MNAVTVMLAEYDDSASPNQVRIPGQLWTGAEQDSSFFKGGVGDFSFDGVIGGGMR